MYRITMAEQGSNNSSIFRKNVFNPDHMDIFVEDEDGHMVNISRACAYDTRALSNTTAYRLEAALEFIATLRDLQDNNDARCSVEQFMAICEEQHTLYDIDFATDNSFYEYDYAKDWAQELVEELYDMDNLPWFVKDNIDWEEVANDLLNSGDYGYCKLENGGIIIWNEI